MPQDIVTANTSAATEDLVAFLACLLRARSVVSFLIDHSGSMKGLRMVSAVLAVEEAFIIKLCHRLISLKGEMPSLVRLGSRHFVRVFLGLFRTAEVAAA